MSDSKRQTGGRATRPRRGRGEAEGVNARRVVSMPLRGWSEIRSGDIRRMRTGSLNG